MNNLELWNKVKQPPPEALKQIKGGRLSGMTDISPQWRYMALTEQFGVCGSGWNFEIVRLWQEKFDNGEVMAFAEIRLHAGEYKDIPGVGGSKLVQMESKGLHYSDEGYKMAITDALGTAAKMLGFGADIYMGKWDGSKYQDKPNNSTSNSKPQKTQETKEDYEKKQEVILKLSALLVKQVEAECPANATNDEKNRLFSELLKEYSLWNETFAETSKDLAKFSLKRIQTIYGKIKKENEGNHPSELAF